MFRPQFIVWSDFSVRVDKFEQFAPLLYHLSKPNTSIGPYGLNVAAIVDDVVVVFSPRGPKFAFYYWPTQP